MPSPRYRCTAEVGFLPAATEIAFAKLDFRVGVGQRVEQFDEFDFDGPPGRWMEPLNEAAVERVKEQVKAGRRRGIGADISAPTEPVVPPKSGMAASFAQQQGLPAITPRDVATDQRTPAPMHEPPRRRAAKAG